mgnify:CR=1 FL=1
MLKVYGLKNCDTCRKARKWLDAEGIAYTFLDVRADGITQDDVQNWSDAAGWEVLLNKRGTTWRGLPDDVKNTISEATAIPLMAEHPATIKRPVFVKPDGSVAVGFTKAVQDGLKG